MGNYGELIVEKRKPAASVSRDVVMLDSPLPMVSHYSYSNRQSQGALICQTHNFPDGYSRTTEHYSSAYSDRIGQWDGDRLKRASAIAGGGDQAWAYRLPSLSDEKLKEFAQVALDLPVVPKHVRVIHYFNVSNGYSCPVVEAIYST